LSKYKRNRNIFLIVKVYICAMNWLILIIAGLFETAFAFCLGKAQETTGKENLYWWSGFAVCLFLSMFLMYKAIAGENGLPIGTAYAVWTGIGAIGTLAVGIFFFGDSASTLRILAALLIVIGIVGLKFAN